jgi:calcineurin-like phosphoesterase family protein
MCREDFFANGFKRPWRTEKQMRNEIIKRHNSKVQENDWVIHGGDFAMIAKSQADKLRPILEKLNGRHILVLGNHDEIKPFTYVNIGFTNVTTSVIMEMDYGVKRKIVVNHDPSVRCMVPEDTIFLCGHIHNLFKSIPEKLTVNIGVDVWDYYPINLQDILKEIYP